MLQLESVSSIWFSIVMVLCFGFIMLFDTFKRVFDEGGALYEIEYRSGSSKSQALIRLISVSMILFYLFQLAQGHFYSNENSYLVILPALFILMYAGSYSREQNFSSLYFKEGYLLFGLKKFKYDEVYLIQDFGRIEVRETSNERVICIVPSKYFNKTDFMEFIEKYGFQEKLKFSSKNAI